MRFRIERSGFRITGLRIVAAQQLFVIWEYGIPGCAIHF